MWGWEFGKDEIHPVKWGKDLRHCYFINWGFMENVNHAGFIDETLFCSSYPPLSIFIQNMLCCFDIVSIIINRQQSQFLITSFLPSLFNEILTVFSSFISSLIH
jgi:hypothetical protein